MGNFANPICMIDVSMIEFRVRPGLAACIWRWMLVSCWQHPSLERRMIMADSTRNWKILFNFCCICIIWGSTFLAVKVAITGIPPFVVTATRYLSASLILILISRLRREALLTWANVRLAAISGFLLTLGNALVCYSATSLPTGLVAVVIGSLPAWIIVLDWRLFRGKSPMLLQVIGILLSLVGVGALTSSHSQHFESAKALVWISLFCSILVWALGTLIQRRGDLGHSIFQFAAVQSLTGGLMIGAMTVWDGTAFIEWRQVPISAYLAVGYLTLAGTVAAATSYVWLTQNADSRVVSTYALITPVVAVWLGWMFAGETITVSTFSNSAIVIVGVSLIVFSGMAKRPRIPFRESLATLIPRRIRRSMAVSRS